ncbi:MAG: efflux RND transporter periplasmic adaptor subunit [Candidatus Omnitrophica bacterium]|nr:efflux RND transporter periplasmic adaptor subunit [Candidatus Omnitrophota bacterium]
MKNIIGNIFASVTSLFQQRIPRIDLKDKNTKKRLIVGALILVVVVVVLARTITNLQGVIFKKKPKEAKAPAVTFEESASPVKAFRVKKTDFRDTLPCLGTVKGYREVNLKFQVAGVIESFNFEEGEKIQEGDIIASLDQRDALLKLKYAEVELKKNQQLYDIGAINAIKLEQAKLEYESAKSDLDKTNIYAMSNGMLGTREKDVGSYVTPSDSNDKIGVFVAIDKVYAEFNVIEKDVPKVSVGQKVDVFSDAYPTKSFSGTIDRLAPIIEGKSRTEVLKVELDNKEGILKPGMFLRALVYTYEKKDALVIPSSAMKKKETEYFVYVINKEEPKKKEIKEKPETEQKKKFSLFGGKTKKDKAEEAKPEIKEKEAEFGIAGEK